MRCPICDKDYDDTFKVFLADGGEVLICGECYEDYSRVINSGCRVLLYDYKGKKGLYACMPVFIWDGENFINENEFNAQ